MNFMGVLLSIHTGPLKHMVSILNSIYIDSELANG